MLCILEATLTRPGQLSPPGTGGNHPVQHYFELDSRPTRKKSDRLFRRVLFEAEIWLNDLRVQGVRRRAERFGVPLTLPTWTVLALQEVETVCPYHGLIRLEGSGYARFFLHWFVANIAPEEFRFGAWRHSYREHLSLCRPLPAPPAAPPGTPPCVRCGDAPAYHALLCRSCFGHLEARGTLRPLPSSKPRPARAQAGR